MEVYMDKDIVTNGNSETNFAAGETFAGDINVDEADEKQNNNEPALYVRESILGMMGNYIHEYDNSTYYGWFKLANNFTGIRSIVNHPELKAWYNSTSKEVKIQNSNVKTVVLYNMTGQAMSVSYDNGVVAVSHLNAGIYVLSAKDSAGKFVGSKKIVLY